MIKLAILNPIKYLKSRITVFRIIFNNYLHSCVTAISTNRKDTAGSDGYLLLENYESCSE
jgi:hypothetical protein